VIARRSRPRRTRSRDSVSNVSALQNVPCVISIEKTVGNCIYVYMGLSTCICVYLDICIYIVICIYTYICMYVYTHIYIYVHVCVYIYKHTPAAVGANADSVAT